MGWLGTRRAGHLFSFSRRRLVCLQLGLEWNHTGNQPLVPHLIHYALEVVDIIVSKVGEPSLPGQIIPYWLAPDFAGGNLLGPAGKPQHAVLDFIERPDSSIHRQLAHLVRLVGIVVPTFGTRIKRVD